MGGSVPRVNRLAHDPESDRTVVGSLPALGARFEAWVSELISDEQGRRNAQLLVGRFSLSHCGLIGWRGSRCVATGERDPQDRESRASGGRNPLAGPVRER